MSVGPDPMQPEFAVDGVMVDEDADGFGPPDLGRHVDFTAAQLIDLQRFRSLLAAANATMNLVGPSAMTTFWRRHVLDSAQLLGLAPAALTWADLGAGAGFPGIVLAVRLKSQAGGRVHLVESQGKRCRFLQQVVDILDLPATVYWARAEALEPTPTVDIVTSRACAPLARLFGYALPFTKRGARGLFLKGRLAEAEIAEARKAWHFTSTLSQSLSDEEGRIIGVEGLRRA